MSFMDTRQKIECQTLCVKMFYIFSFVNFFSVKKKFFLYIFITEKNVLFSCVVKKNKILKKILLSFFT